MTRIRAHKSYPRQPDIGGGDENHATDKSTPHQALAEKNKTMQIPRTNHIHAQIVDAHPYRISGPTS